MIENIIDVPSDSSDQDLFMDQMRGLMTDMVNTYPEYTVRVKVTKIRRTNVYKGTTGYDDQEH